MPKRVLQFSGKDQKRPNIECTLSPLSQDLFDLIYTCTVPFSCALASTHLGRIALPLLGQGRGRIIACAAPV